MTRKCFYSFHYKDDVIRAATVRQIGSIEGNRSATDNKWEEVTSGGNSAIQKWILGQMRDKSCTIVLVGSNTANRKWINYEIVESWNSGMGLVGINIHGLKNFQGNISTKGKNPFSFVKYDNSGTMLSSIVQCYNPQGTNSKERYKWISTYLPSAVEEAIKIRRDN